MISYPDFDSTPPKKPRKAVAKPRATKARAVPPSTAALFQDLRPSSILTDDIRETIAESAFSDDAIEEPRAVTVLTVGELNRRARLLLERGLATLTVRGEISNLTFAASGHVYFALKDREAQVRCTLWRAQAQRLDFRPREGDQVEVRASVTLYEARGDFQLSIESLRRAGAGALFEAFLRLKTKLTAEGLFDPAKKRALPTFPAGIGLITSTNAAALRDVLTTLRRRAPMIPIVLYPAPVQGADAARALVAAVRTASARAAQDGVGVLIVCRGGGSIEDLWSFNDEALARAIAASPVPVISGVGHETDFTLCDFAADVRAATPTAAAELATPDVADLRRTLRGLVAQAQRAMQRRLQDRAQGLDWLTRRLQPPSARLAAQRAALHALVQRLRHAHGAKFEEARAEWVFKHSRLRSLRPQPAHLHVGVVALAQRLAHAFAQTQSARTHALGRAANALELLAPQRVLERGYSLTTDAQGVVVRDAARLAANDALNLRFASGSVAVRVAHSVQSAQ